MCILNYRLLSNIQEAEQVLRQIRDARNLTALARAELQMRAILVSWYKRIAITLRRYPAIIQSAAGAIRTTIQIARPVMQRWNEFWGDLEDFLLDQFTKAADTLIEVGEELERHAIESKAATAPNPRKTANTTGDAQRAGETFRDIEEPWCPEMVVVPAGRFLMGSPSSEVGRNQNEGPRHWVTIDYSFAVSRWPATYESFDLFAEATGLGLIPDYGDGRGTRPMLGVSWNDAQSYARWLTELTGQQYRLLTEAEWEYACRAGTSTRYWWGNDPPGWSKYKETDWENRTTWKPTPVDRLPLNPWGLGGMPGHACEWVEDIYHRNYFKAPRDGSARLESNEGHMRVLRGHTRYAHPRYLRPANRIGHDPNGKNFAFGIRLARVI